MRLDSCNFRRDNLALTNSKNDLSKLISLIATNQIPRVGFFLNVLLNQGHGINTVIEKFYQAILSFKFINVVLLSYNKRK